MARNRYGWQKRGKELARKEKSDEKMRRRQGKITSLPAEEILTASTEGPYEPEETAAPEEDPADSYRQAQD